MAFLYPADIVVRDANIITMNPAMPRAEALAVKDGRLLAIGSNEEINAVVGKDTMVRDLEGATVTPGFIESHNHTLIYAQVLKGIDLTQTRSIEQIIQLVTAQARIQPEGTWIVGYGYDQMQLMEKRHPFRQDLDQATPHHFVRLNHKSGHVSVLNSHALAQTGITSSTPDPPEGIIERDERSGDPTGVFVEFSALNLIEKAQPQYSHEDLVVALGLANDRMVSEGITSAMDAGVGINSQLRPIAVYQEAVERGKLQVRHNLAILIDAVFDLDRFDDELPLIERRLLGLGLRTNLGDHRLKIGPMKFIPDGALSTATAATREPYGADPKKQTTGKMLIEPDALMKVVPAVHKLGWQLSLHGIGDRCLDAVLDALEAAISPGRGPDARPRIEHAIMVDQTHIERMKKLGAIVVPQPGFIWGLGDNYISQIGSAKAARTMPFRTFIDRGITVAFGSDRPVINGAPLLGIHGAVNQKTMCGQEYAPNERISAEEALRCYTINGAYASFEEHIKGSLEIGKLADLVILSDDLTIINPERIMDIQVLATMINGHFVYDRI